MKKLKIILLLYGCLLLASWFIQWVFPVADMKSSFQQSELVEIEKDTVDIKFEYLNSKNSTDTVVIFGDKTNNSLNDILKFSNSLYESYDVIIPHYPVNNIYGQSISLSTGYRANLLSEFIQDLQIDSIHIIANGYGGLVALDFLNQEKEPEVKSLTLISSMGVKEYHLLGFNTLNKGLYSLLYPIVFFSEYLIPHFGWFHHQRVDINFVKSRVQMDQTNVRDQFEKIDVPVLILHSLKDPYIPAGTAEEHHRLLPQSRLFTKDTIDLLPKHTDWVADHTNNFLKSVAENRAAVRSDSPEERIQESKREFDPSIVDTVSGLTLVLILVLLALSTLINEDLACVGGGLLATAGIINFWHAVLGAFAGIFIADIGTYWLGRWAGKGVLRYIPFRWIIKEKDLEQAEKLFNMYGMYIIFATRFLPGTRLPTYLSSGMLNIRFSFFLIYFSLSIIIMVPFLVWVTMLIGQPMIDFVDSYKNYAPFLVIVMILLFYIIAKILPLFLTMKGRRRIVLYMKLLKRKID